MPVGPSELLIVLLIVLFLFGAGKLPEVGGALGKGIREFRDGFKEEQARASKAATPKDEG